MTTPLLECSKIFVLLKGKTILRDVSLRVQPGEFLGIVGANGSGKTTLLRTMVGLLQPQHGKVEIMGKELHDFPPEILARKRAYLPQSGECHWPIPVERVVELGRLPFIEPWRKPSGQDRKIMDDIIRECELEEIRYRPVDTLSGGEQSRVMAARALVGEPEILLADEPLTGLDPYHQLQLMALLKKMVLDSARAVVIVMHDLSLAARFCDRLIMLHEGTILADGTPDRVLTEENISKAYRITIRRVEHHGQKSVVPWECL